MDWLSLYRVGGHNYVRSFYMACGEGAVIVGEPCRTQTLIAQPSLHGGYTYIPNILFHFRCSAMRDEYKVRVSHRLLSRMFAYVGDDDDVWGRVKTATERVALRSSIARIVDPEISSDYTNMSDADKEALIAWVAYSNGRSAARIVRMVKRVEEDQQDCTLVGSRFQTRFYRFVDGFRLYNPRKAPSLNVMASVIHTVDLVSDALQPPDDDRHFGVDLTDTLDPQCSMFDGQTSVELQKISPTTLPLVEALPRVGVGHAQVLNAPYIGRSLPAGLIVTPAADEWVFVGPLTVVSDTSRNCACEAFLHWSNRWCDENDSRAVCALIIEEGRRNNRPYVILDEASKVYYQEVPSAYAGKAFSISIFRLTASHITLSAMDVVGDSAIEYFDHGYISAEPEELSLGDGLFGFIKNNQHQLYFSHSFQQRLRWP